MESLNENNSFKRNSFLRYYVLLILIANTIGFFYAINPKYVGLYIALFVYVPVNFVFMLAGLVIVRNINKGKNSLLYYSVVILLPVITTIILILLVDTFAPPGGC